MIRTVIIDDEPRNTKLLEAMISDYCPELEIVGTADDPNEVLPLVQNLKPQLLLLDIEFPGGTIFPVLEKLPGNNIAVIFITAHNTYAAEAFKQHAVDYVLKPLTVEKLLSAVNRAVKDLQSESGADILQLAKALKASLDHSDKIPLPTSDGILFINESEVIRCEASGRYTIIHLQGKKKLTVTRTLKEMEALLNHAHFFRAHNSHIINLNLVKKYHHGRGGTIELEDGSLVEVSAIRKEELLKVLMNKIEE